MNKELLVQYIAGTCTREEAARVLEYIQTPPGNLELQAIMQKLEHADDLQHPVDPMITQRILARLRPQLGSRKKARMLPLLGWRAAASILLLLGFGLWGYKYRRDIHAALFPVQYAETVMPAGYTGKITLDDGTVVTLNSQSRIRYPRKLNDQALRQVYLEGEAFFQVAKNAAKPFVVTAGKAEIRVLGTAFNVRESVTDSSLVVAVTEGVVSLSKNTGNGKALRLQVGDVGLLQQGQLTAFHTGNTHNYLSWESGQLAFDSIRLGDVARQLEHLYHLRISFRDPRLRQVLLTAEMKRGTADYVLKEIATYLNLGYTRDRGNRVIFHRK